MQARTFLFHHSRSTVYCFIPVVNCSTSQSGYTNKSNVCYFLSDTKADFYTARFHCSVKGGDLARLGQMTISVYAINTLTGRYLVIIHEGYVINSSWSQRN